MASGWRRHARTHGIGVTGDQLIVSQPSAAGWRRHAPGHGTAEQVFCSRSRYPQLPDMCSRCPAAAVASVAMRVRMSQCGAGKGEDVCVVPVSSALT